MNEIPTLDLKLASLNVKTPPTRSLPETVAVLSYEDNVVPVPLKVLELVGF